MKKRLLIVIGAGASLDFGMPSVADVGSLLSCVSQISFSLSDNPDKNLYDFIENTILKHLEASIIGSNEVKINFEDIMYAVASILTLYPQGIFTSSLSAFIDHKMFPDVNLYGRRCPIDPNIWHEFSSFLSDNVIDFIRSQCISLNRKQTKKLRKLSQFFSMLSKKYDVSIINLNYDDLAYRCLPDLVTCFSNTGVFDDRLLFNRLKWPCIIHLHGSVHFNFTSSSNDLHAITWEDDLSVIRINQSSGRGYTMTRERIPFPTSTIIAGFGKSSQLLRRPYRTYYSEADRLISQSDALLCLGYGFGDDHLNIALSGYRDDRNRPVIVIDWSDCDAMSALTSDTDESHSTISRVMHLFQNQPWKMNALDRKIPGNIRQLKEERAFEFSEEPSRPLAIWYNGMYEACLYRQKVDNILGRYLL